MPGEFGAAASAERRSWPACALTFEGFHVAGENFHRVASLPLHRRTRRAAHPILQRRGRHQRKERGARCGVARLEA